MQNKLLTDNRQQPSQPGLKEARSQRKRSHRWVLYHSLLPPWSICYILNNTPAQAKSRDSESHQMSQKRGDKIIVQDYQGSSTEEAKNLEKQKSQISEHNILHCISPWDICQFLTRIQWESKKPIEVSAKKPRNSLELSENSCYQREETPEDRGPSNKG